VRGHIEFQFRLFCSGKATRATENVARMRRLFCVGLNLKGKAVPLRAWSGPEGSRNLRFPDYMTTAQDGDKVVSFTHRPPLPSGNSHGTHFC